MTASSARRALLLILPALCLLLGLWILRGDGPAPAPGGVEPEAAAGAGMSPPGAATAPDLPQDLERKQAESPAGEAAADGADVAAPIQTAVVRVVRGDGAPLAERPVVLLPEASNGGHLPAPEREAYRLANQDEQLDRWGRAFPCDDTGRATIPVLEGNWFPVGARAGALWGRSAVDLSVWRPGTEIVVVLHAALHLPVLVLDEAGDPVAGAPVSYRVDRRGGSTVDFDQALTDREGRAQLRHLQESLDRAGATRHSAALALPFAPEVRKDFDPLAPPQEPLLLILPPHGSVEVEVQGIDGKPPTRRIQVALQLPLPQAGPAPQPGPLNPRKGVRWAPVEEGVARFDRVGIGLELEYGADFGDGFLQRAVGAGPQRPGETVRLILRATDDLPCLSGRILDGAGAPLADRPWTAELFPADSDRRMSVVRLRTDAEGRFRAPMAGAGLPAGAAVLLASESERGRVRFLAAHLTLPIPESGLDLGDLCFGGPLAARGRALGPEGEARADAQVRFAPAREQSPFERAEVGPYGNLHCTADEEGRFAWLGPLPNGSWRLSGQLRGDSSLAAAPVDFAPGADELLLRFARPPGIYGRVLLDPGVPPEAIAVRLESPEGGGQGTNLRAATGEFRLRVQRGAVLDLVLRAERLEEELWRRGNLAVDPQAVLDVGEIDLRGRLQTSRLVLRNADGAIIQRATLWAEPAAPERPRFAIPSEFPLAVVRTRPLRCWIEAPGHALAEVLVDRPELELRLGPGLPVRLECSGVPADGRWRLRLMRDPASGAAPVPCQLTSAPAQGTTSVLLQLPAGGDWTALLEIADPGTNTFRTQAAALGEPAPVLRVAESSGEQLFRLEAVEGAFR